MGDALRKVKPGDPLAIPAEAFNAFIDAARDVQSRRLAQRQGAQPAQDPGTTVVLVRNDSGADRDRFDVLGIAGPLISPSDDLDAFKSRVALTGVTPTAANHTGKFVVLLEPVADGEIGRACIAGVCPAKLGPVGDTDLYADIAAGDPSKLQPAPSGAARILWYVGSGSPRWSVVRIGEHADGLRWFRTAEDFTYSKSDSGCYVMANPCNDKDGNGLDQNTSVKIWLPRVRGAGDTTDDPNIEYGCVLPAMRDPYQSGGESVEYVAQWPYLDGTIFRSIRLWHGDYSSIPKGWHLCDGSMIDGHSGKSYPDMRARFIVGYYKDGLPAPAQVAGSLGDTGEYASVAGTGGKTWHGMNENGHPDHKDHVHGVDPAIMIKVQENWSTGTNVPCWSSGSWWSSVQKTTPGHADMRFRHGGPVHDWPAQTPTDEAHDHADTDNRPCYYVLAYIIRADNSKNHGATVPW